MDVATPCWSAVVGSLGVGRLRGGEKALDEMSIRRAAREHREDLGERFRSTAEAKSWSQEAEARKRSVRVVRCPATGWSIAYGSESSCSRGRIVMFRVCSHPESKAMSR